MNSSANRQPKSRSRLAKQVKAKTQKVSVPSAISSVNRWSQPKVGSRGENTIVVSHREFLTNVIANGDVFNPVSSPLNPGLAGVFAWLSHIAQNYESYRFVKLQVEYVPLVPTSQAGTIMMGVDFDAADAVPISKVGLMSFQGAISGPVWNPIKIDCLKANLRKMAESRYVRGGNLAANLDIKTYDVGNLIVATANAGVFAGFCGEVYLDYSVELITPQYNIVDEAADDSAKIQPTAGVTKAALFGTARTITGGLPIGVNATGTGIRFDEAGDYLIDLKATGTVFAGNPTIAYSSASMVATVIGNLVDAAATTMLSSLVVRVPDKGSTLYLDYGAGAATVTAMTFRLARYLTTLG